MKHFRPSLLLILFFVGLSELVYSQCQTTNWTNPSFEGTAQPHVLPPGWSNCNGTTSDTQPGSWGITTPATNGSTWCGLVSVPGWQETASQVFSPCLNAGQTYNFTIDILKVDETSDGGGDCDGHIELWGGGSTGSACDMSVLLWQTPTLVTNGPNQNNWITYTISFTPSTPICQLTFQAIGGNCATGAGDFYCGLDNISPIQPAILSTPSVVQNVSCFGGSNGSVTTTAATGGQAPYTYTWSTTPAQVGQTATGLPAGTYTVTIQDNIGCSITQTVTVTQPPTVNITLTPTAANCGSGGSITTSVTGGSPPFTYAWSPSGTGQNPTNLPPGPYTVTVTGGGCTYTASTTVGNGGAAVASFTQSADQCLAGNSFNFTNTGTTGGGVTYNWSFPGANVTGSTLENPTGISWPAVGSYVVSFTVNAGGCQSVATGTVNITNNLNFSVAGPDTICEGNNAVWNITGPVATYNWTGGLTGTSQTLIPTTTTTYTINGADANGCSSSLTFTINVAPTMTLSVGGFPATCNGVCDGQMVCLVTPTTGQFATYTYAWSGGGSTPSINNACAGNYTINVTDGAGCVSSSTVAITEPTALTVSNSNITNATCNGNCDGSVLISAAGGTPNYTYVWSPSGTGNNPTNLCAGNYSVTVNDANGCSSSTNFSITQPTVIAASINPVTGLCQGQTANLTAIGSGGNGGYTYTWSTGTTPATGASVTASPTVTTNYTVTVTDANNCPAATATISVVVATPLAVVASNDATVCNGQSSNLSALASGGNGVYTYTWAPATSPATGAAVVASPGSTTTYTVTVTDGCGTPAATDNVIITVNPIPSLTITTTDPTGCAPWCVDFTGSSNPASASCNWTFTNNATANNNCNPTVCFAAPGQYGATLTVTDINGCVNTMTQNNIVTVFANPNAEFSFGPQPTTELEANITFTDNSTANIVTQIWNFGDSAGSVGSGSPVSYTYSAPGQYQVQLLVVNSDGCVDSITHTVVIDPDFSFYVPNAFSPLNGDGVNDFFFPKGIGIDTDHYEMWIYDRWGNMIWNTTDFFDKWDGKVKGHAEIVQQDVYVWKVKLKDFSGKKRSYVGHVTVIK